MNAMRQALKDFLENSTPEQLQAELTKGYRPLLQKLDDPVLVVVESIFTFPAKVSFFQGDFAQEQSTEVINTATPVHDTSDVTDAVELAA